MPDIHVHVLLWSNQCCIPTATYQQYLKIGCNQKLFLGRTNNKQSFSWHESKLEQHSQTLNKSEFARSKNKNQKIKTYMGVVVTREVQLEKTYTTWAFQDIRIIRIIVAFTTDTDLTKSESIVHVRLALPLLQSRHTWIPKIACFFSIVHILFHHVY